MLTKMNYEQELLKEIKDLAPSDKIRIIRMVHFMKKEILEKNKKDSKLIIMDYAGMLENLTDDESDRFNEAVKRTSLFRDRMIRL
ncbi:MAG: hypothetical protein WA151_03725 [Desulfatirhabdiaceae bacterium]